MRFFNVAMAENAASCDVRGFDLRRHVFDFHREPSEFALHADFVNVFVAARHGHYADAHRNRSEGVDGEAQRSGDVGGCGKRASGLFGEPSKITVLP